MTDILSARMEALQGMTPAVLRDVYRDVFGGLAARTTDSG